MRSSYKSSIDFSSIIKTICFIKNPSHIVEFGILDGFSLLSFAHNTNKNCIIDGYDIFEDFNGKSGNLNELNNVFKNYNNVSIKKGDFYKKILEYNDNSIDILHVDIANDGDVYEYIFNTCIKKIKKVI